MTKFVYPDIRRDESFVEKHFDVDVPDPYRWLEDVDSAETAAFVEKQNAFSMPYLESYPNREDISKRLTELFDYPRYGTPYRRGKNYFMSINTGLQNQAVLHIMRGGLDAKPEVFIDPNELSKDGTVSFSNVSQTFSHDGKWYAYGINKSGSDWTSVRIRNVETNEDLPEELSKLKFSRLDFTLDNKGFFYSCYPDASDGCEGKETTDQSNQKLYYHRLNTPQSKDVLVFEKPDQPDWRFSAYVSHDGAYLHLSMHVTCDNNLWFFYKFDNPVDTKVDGLLKFEPVVETFNADYHFVASQGPIQYIHTNRNAPNFRLIAVDLSTPESRKEVNWKDIIAEDTKNVLENVSPTRNDLLIASYMVDVVSIVELRRMDTGELIRKLPLPIGTLSSISSEQDHDDIFYSFTSFLTPSIIYHLKLTDEMKSEPIVFKEVKPKGFDAGKFVTEQMFYVSKDGTKIPLFVVHRKDFVSDGNAPCLLYGYGGFNISLQPWFSVGRLILMEHFNGVFALANIRGGGEYGKAWHYGGNKLNKQNCFDDFIAAGEYLVDNKYTSPEKLIIQGGSNGGLLVAACALQRPDLFGCVIGEVGVMDLLRFHKFTIGSAWISDYGNPDEEEAFRNLIKFSPYHNVPDGASVKRIPAILLNTADHDDRVVPLHSFKLIAELQYKLGQYHPDTPIMIRIQTKAGHGFGKPIEKIIQEATDTYCFISNSLKLSYVKN